MGKVVHIRILYLGGTAECRNCETWFAWKFEWDRVEDAEHMQCPTCKSRDIGIHIDGVYHEIAVTETEGQ